MEPEKPPQPSSKHSVENLLISSHDVIGRSISPNLTFSAMASLPSQSLESSQDSSSLQSSCASSAPSPSVQTRVHHKRDTSRGSDVSDTQPPDSDSSSAVSVSVKKEKEAKSGSDASKTEKVDKPTSERTSAKKKSSWYNVLYPTYKTRSEGFKRIFRDLPVDERLVVDYSCALQRDILVHGRLYVSPNYLSFYANIFGWETSVSVPWRQVTGLTKEKTALVIPNAIQVSTNNNEKLFFTSFGARDKTFLMLFRIWQNALLDQSLSSQELWQWVHACYGDELGLTSDDEDYVSSTGLEDEQGSSLLASTTQANLDLSLKVGDLPPLDIEPPAVLPTACTLESTESSGPPQKSLPVPVPGCEHSMTPAITPESPSPPTPATNFITPESDVLQTDLSDTTESDVEKSSTDLYKRTPPACLAVNPVCPGPHEGRQSIDTVFQLPVDQLFALLFTTSTFFVAFHTARKTCDIQASSWQPNKETGLKVRQVSFTVAVNQAVGPKTAQVIENQTMLNISKPGRMYVIEIEANNGGIPYADSFYLQNHVCILKVSESQARLCIYTQIKYRKSVWGLVKGFIEKNTWAGVEDFYSSLNRALGAEAEALLAGEATSATGKRKSRIVRHRRARGHHLTPSSVEAASSVASTGDISPTLRNPLQLVGGLTDINMNHGAGGGLWSWFILATLLSLLLLNAVLYHKLWGLEAWGKEAALGRIDMPLFKQPPQSHDEWLRLLQQQEVLHRKEMDNWQQFLNAAITLLRQAEDALEQLQKTITPKLLNPKTGGSWGDDQAPPDNEEL